MRRLIIVVASSVLLLVAGAVAVRTTAGTFQGNLSLDDRVAQTTESPMPRRDRGWLRDLNLSAEQTRQIQQIRDRYQERLKGDRDTLRQAEQELRTLMAGNANEREIRDKYSQVKELRAKLSDERFNSLLEMRNVLTVEQRQKFAERMQKRLPGMRQRMRG